MDYQAQNGLMATYREGWRSRGETAWIVGFVLLAFYLTLYFTEWMTPFAEALGLRSKWYLYGALYCVAMIGGGVYYLRRHGNSRYNRVRIAVNVFVQVVLAFTLPFVMYVLTERDFYFSYLWPLKIEYLYPSTLAQFPVYIVVYSIVASFVVVPVLALLYGKRWYCSWVCGCGALANTFGDPWRHLSDKSTRAWRFELVSVHTVLLLAIATTTIVVVDAFIGQQNAGFHAFAGPVKQAYGFVVGAILAGIVGVVVYPILGTRVWCRYFCPMAALLGLIQKAGRFRITVKKDMCISCGNCSAYCEMGIDVRSYAQSNQSFTRAACVGCGACAHVCPRGVLKLENRWPKSPDKERQRLRIVNF
jgi:polyferredoxin